MVLTSNGTAGCTGVCKLHKTNLMDGSQAEGLKPTLNSSRPSNTFHGLLYLALNISKSTTHTKSLSILLKAFGLNSAFTSTNVALSSEGVCSAS